MMQDCANFRIIVSDLKGARRYDEVRVGIGSDILRCAPTDPQRLIQVVAKMFWAFPQLSSLPHSLKDIPGDLGLDGSSLSRIKPKPGETPVILGVANVEKPSIDRIKVIAEAKHFATVQVVCAEGLPGHCSGPRYEQTPENHRRLNGSRQQTRTRRGVPLYRKVVLVPFLPKMFRLRFVLDDP